MSRAVSKISLSQSRFMQVIDAINDASSIEEIISNVPKIMPITMATYHHFAAAGAWDHRNLSKLYTHNMPDVITNFMETQSDQLWPPSVIASLGAGEFIWLSDMIEKPYVKKLGHDKMARQALSLTGDGLCIPLFGPNNRNGYMFMAFGQTKDKFANVFPFQVQALTQKLHVRYCVMTEQFHKQVNLTKREIDVLDLMSYGKTNSEIADILNIAASTVGGHVANIFLKLEVSDRVSAAMRAQTIKISL